jgi:hypothetical protein
MRNPFKQNIKIMSVAMITALVTAIGATFVFSVAPAIAHGVKHAKFAHNADKVDGKHANQLRSIAEGRSFSYVDGTFHNVGATPTNILRFNFSAPRNGFAEVSYAHTDNVGGTAQTVVSWIELDPATDCDATRKVKATEMFNSMGVGEYGSSSASAIVPVSRGSHRAILCVVAGAAGTAIGVGSLTATFIPAGQVSVSAPPAPRQGPRFGR